MAKNDVTKVAAAIIRQDDKILICRRGAGGSCSGLWEFPGGKLEDCETLEDCLIRECWEELGLLIKIKGIYTQTSHFYGDKKMDFTFFDAEIMSGEMQMSVHQDIRWVMPKELDKYAFCPADVEVAERLRRESSFLA